MLQPKLVIASDLRSDWKLRAALYCSSTGFPGLFQLSMYGQLSRHLFDFTLDLCLEFCLCDLQIVTQLQIKP